jgi:hypothetical protein
LLPHELRIDIHLAHIIYDNGYFQTIPVVEHVVKERCFAGAQESG